jgi:hypothetical protein
MYTQRNDDSGAGGMAPRKMFTGNWVCGTCGSPITELPFEPDPSRLGSLKCRECHKKSRQDKPSGGAGYRRF